MPLELFVIIVIVSAIQSIFGVGVLLFGTPILLLLGYDFISTLYIVLPVSLIINFIQIASDYKNIDGQFLRGVLLITVPFIIIVLSLIATTEIDVVGIVAIFLIFVSLTNYNEKIKYFFQQLFRFQKTYMLFMGLIHGLTNLGGSLLTAIIHKNKYSKSKTRVTIAACYAIFAITQTTTLYTTQNGTLSLLTSSPLAITGLITYLFTEKIVYVKISDEFYHKLFSIFLFVSGIALLFRS